MFRIEIQNAEGITLASASGEREAALVYAAEYQPGDVVRFAAPQENVRVQVDQAVAGGVVYLPKRAFVFAIPFGDAKNGFAPQAFAGALHALRIEPAEKAEGLINLALNPFDQHEPSGCFPHATANVETRGEAQFWARNAIDGVRFNDSHGPWPFHSWGIGERRDAWLKIDFGRPVRVGAIGITLRADFPHDAWWERGTLDFSDGHTGLLLFAKTAGRQMFETGEREVTWICLRDLVKADDPSPFPALTQIEAFGYA